MEKQHYFINFTLLDHLPRIFNMMHIVNMMVFGLVVSQPVFVLMGLTSLHKSIRLSSQRLLSKFRSKWNFNRKFLTYIALIALALLFLVWDQSSENLVLITTLFALVIVVNRVLSIMNTELPAGHVMRHCR